MKTSNRHMRWVTGVLLASIVMATLAPMAQAGSRRYKGRDASYGTRGPARHHGSGSVYVVRRSSAGPAIAGFLGGLFLGATIAHAAPDGFAYHDPYCDRRFVSLEIYRTHLHRHHHPRVVRVIEIDSGHCVDTWQYRNGDWRDWDERDWDDD